MVGEVAKRNLYDAARNGQVATLQEDPFLVDQVSFACSRNLLHIATMHGQLAIVEAVLNINQNLARDVDSQSSSPLHIAAAQGGLEITKKLLSVAPEMCWWRDSQGMNPVHVAAMNGHVEILRVLIEEEPLAAMERLDRGQTVLHLCLKHDRRAALVYLVANLKDLVNVEDDDGDTLLHSAVRLKQVEVLQHLVEKHTTYELPTNSKGITVQQICKESSQDEASRRIDEILSCRISYSGQPVGSRMNLSDMTMVVVVLIATMAFQAVVSPAGGVWQDDSSSSLPHKAGEAVMASTRPKIFENFIQANKVAFGASIATIVLLTTGLPSRNVVFTMAAMCSMWLSLASIGISYVASALAITPNKDTASITHVIHVVIAVFLIIYAMFCFSSLVTYRSRIMAYIIARRWKKPTC